MLNNFKKMKMAFVGAALLIALSACSSNGEERPSDDTSEEDPISAIGPNDQGGSGSTKEIANVNREPIPTGLVYLVEGTTGDDADDVTIIIEPSYEGAERIETSSILPWKSIAPDMAPRHIEVSMTVTSHDSKDAVVACSVYYNKKVLVSHVAKGDKPVATCEGSFDLEL